MSKVSRKHNGLKLVYILDDELSPRWSPICNFTELLILSYEGLTLRISKVLEMNPAISVVYIYSIDLEDIAKGMVFKFNTIF